MKKRDNYVCLSDLHLGAKYSVLSSRDHHADYAANHTANCFAELAHCMRKYIPKVYGDDLPKLVLLGDIVDFSFASASDIVTALNMMLDVFFPDNEAPLFQKEIIYIPGNHDHRFWQNEKDTLLLEATVDEQINDGGRFETSELFRSSSFPSEFLNRLPRAKSKGLLFELRYPNWAIYKPSTGKQHARQIVFHHGHYIEPLYRLMTTVTQLINNTKVPNIEELERQNGGWIDFFWSSLGASPAQRDSTVLLFDIMQNPAATYEYSQKLAALLGNFLSTQVGLSPGKEVISTLSLQDLLNGVLSTTLSRSFHAERATTHTVLSKEGWKGLEWYLAGPVHQQIIEQSKLANLSQTGIDDTVTTDTTFVFGHTHKPFEGAIGVGGYQKPIKLLNSGGWVVDEADFNSVQGAAAIFIDAELNSASLRLFQAPVNGEMPTVSIQGVSQHNDTENALMHTMLKNLNPTDWVGFQTSIAAAIELRALEARDRFFDRYSHDGVKRHA